MLEKPSTPLALDTREALRQGHRRLESDLSVSAEVLQNGPRAP
jgi:hypothetical protein